MTEQSALLLRKQLAELNKNPVEGFSAGLIDDDDIYKWEVVIIGPQDTLFEGGFFKAYLTFPYDYPLRPPKMKFITEIWHPNVAKNGDVCISILHEPGEDKFGYEKPEERWLPIHTVETIMISVISMLADPNSDSPANVDAAMSQFENPTSEINLFPTWNCIFNVIYFEKLMIFGAFEKCHEAIRPENGVSRYRADKDDSELPGSSTGCCWIHPALTAGQRRYLCSIASVYSTQHMRHQMKQHYLNVLRTCIQSGQIPTCTKRYGNELRDTRAFSRDAQKKDLALRSVNPAHSAYACFLFSPMFFQTYSLESAFMQGKTIIKCKLVMKSVLPLFRCVASIERNVQRCQISIHTPRDCVMIQFFCRHGITKTHNLRFQDSEALQAVFAAHLCPNVLKAPARLLGDMVMHFPVFQEEITLSTTPLKVSLRNYCEDGNDHLKMMYTEMSLHPDEFHSFQVGVDSDVTFCLKELRGLLSFAESLCLPVSVHFGAAGKPVCFSVEDMMLEATVVLATLTGSDSRGPSQPAGTVAPESPRFTDAAALPVASGRAEITQRQDVASDLVPSSQGSPLVNPPSPRLLLPHITDSERPAGPDEDCASVTTSPAPSMICSLLFRALSSEEIIDDALTKLPVLACDSDEEESMEEDVTGRMSL
ncbi:uncharacterized protein V6R79_009041 [Siganus canaliculatus]